MIYFFSWFLVLLVLGDFSCAYVLVQNDDANVRRKAVQLLGRIFAVPEHHAAHDYHGLFVEFLNRFYDKSMEVRIGALQCVKGLYMANPSGSEVQQVLCELLNNIALTWKFLDVLYCLIHSKSFLYL